LLRSSYVAFLKLSFEGVKTSFIPDFEIGIWNAWIFTIWPIIVGFLGPFVVKEKKVSQRLRICSDEV
jgi:hypothetical protein